MSTAHYNSAADVPLLWRYAKRNGLGATLRIKPAQLYALYTEEGFGDGFEDPPSPLPPDLGSTKLVFPVGDFTITLRGARGWAKTGELIGQWQKHRSVAYLPRLADRAVLGASLEDTLSQLERLRQYLEVDSKPCANRAGGANWMPEGYHAVAIWSGNEFQRERDESCESMLTVTSSPGAPGISPSWPPTSVLSANV